MVKVRLNFDHYIKIIIALVGGILLRARYENANGPVGYAKGEEVDNKARTSRVFCYLNSRSIELSIFS